jgi:hypothetical protein
MDFGPCVVECEERDVLKEAICTKSRHEPNNFHIYTLTSKYRSRQEGKGWMGYGLHVSQTIEGEG